jgi:VCBS repeat-containing protein
MALKFYLTIDGVNGGSLAKGHEGAFEVSGYSFDVSSLIGATAGSGTGSPKPDFSPLVVDLDLATGLTTILSAVAAGKTIKSIGLVGVGIDGDGKEQKFYDLKLGDVVVTKYHDTNTGRDSLGFDYSKIVLTTTAVNNNGALGKSAITSWDILKNTSENVTVADPVAASGQPDGTGALKYYLTIDGVNGGSISDLHKGAFEIDGYSFDVSRSIIANPGGGGGLSKPDFSPLIVDLDLAAGLTTILGDVAKGKTIKSIGLVGVTGNKKEQTVYDLKLGDAVVTKYHDTNTGHDSLSFNYNKIVLTTTALNNNGALGASATTSWDILNKTSNNVTVADPVAATENPDGTIGASDYYLTIDGVNGGSLAQGHQGAFEVSGYSFDVSSIIANIRSGGVSKPDFSPLIVGLDLAAGLTKILSDVATGKTIKSIRLVGVGIGGDGKEQKFYDLKLGDVVVTKYHDTNTGHDSLSFDYSKIVLTTTALNNNGALGASATISWDILGNTDQGVTVANPVAASGQPDGTGVLKYYLTIDGVNGGSISDLHKGAFEIDGYSFDVGRIIVANLGGGGGLSKPDFSPLIVDLDLAAGLTTILSDVATGKTIKSISLVGVTGNKKEQTVYDLKLGDVVVTKYHDTNTGHDSLSFDYNKIVLTTTALNNNGALGASATTSWDILKNTSNNVTVDDPKAATKNPDGTGALNYFLTIDGVNGGSTNDQHKGAFEVSGYSFNVSNIVTRSLGGGADVGKPDFSPLIIDLDLAAGLTTILSDVATGKHIKSIRLEGITSDGKTVYDLKLGDVIVTKYQDTNSGHDSLSFDYSKIVLTTTALDNNGALGASATTSWDILKNTNSATVADPVAAPGNPDGTGTSKYFLTIDGVNGGSINDLHKGAFEIDRYSFDVSSIAPINSGGGLSTSKPTFAPLTVGLDLVAGFTDFLREVATGKHIKSIRLEGVNSDGKTVYDLKLGNVIVTKYYDTNTGLDGLSFDYDKILLATKSIGANGIPGLAATFARDLKTGEDIVFIPDPKPINNTPPTVNAALSSIKSEDDIAYSIDLLQGASDVDLSDVLTASAASFTAVDQSGVAVSTLGLTQSGKSLQVDPNAYNYLALGKSVTITGKYNISDGNGGTVPQTVAIKINGANDAPTVSAINIIGTSSIPFTSKDFINAFSDVDSDPLTKIQIQSLPKNGGLRLNGTAIALNQEIATADLNNLVFVPNRGFNGNASFSWNGFDGNTYAKTSATVNITIKERSRTLSGDAENNILVGTANSDRIDGKGGDDIIRGLQGDDILSGGPGNNVLDGGEGFDQVLEIGDFNFILSNTKLIGNGTDNLISIESASLEGGISGNRLDASAFSGAVTLDGKEGDDILIGGLGGNIFIGGSGNDLFKGGAGVDRFVYDTNDNFRRMAIGLDTIENFTVGTDKIVLSRNTFSELKSRSGNGFSRERDFAVVDSDTAAARSRASIVYSQGTGALFYNENGADPGLGQGAKFAILSGTPVLTANDFEIRG